MKHIQIFLMSLFMISCAVQLLYSMQEGRSYKHDAQKSQSSKKKVTFNATLDIKDDSKDHTKYISLGRLTHVTLDTVIVGDDPIEDAIIDAVLPAFLENSEEELGEVDDTNLFVESKIKH